MLQPALLAGQPVQLRLHATTMSPVQKYAADNIVSYGKHTRPRVVTYHRQPPA